MKRFLRRICGVCMAMGLIFLSATAWGQWVVSDPANTAQNTISVAQEAQLVAGQIQEIQQQFEQLQQMRRDLEQLTPSQLAQLGETFRRLDELYEQAEQISMRWENVKAEYDTLYEAPPVDDTDEFRAYRKRWQEQTDNAIRSAMQSHGVVDSYQDRQTNLDSYSSASESAEGTLAAIQAGNKVAELLAEQQMEMTEIIAADSRAMLSYFREEQARRETQEERAEDRMMRDYGGSAPPRNVPNQLPAFE